MEITPSQDGDYKGDIERLYSASSLMYRYFRVSCTKRAFYGYPLTEPRLGTRGK